MTRDQRERSLETGFRFGSFELFPESGELRHRGRRVRLAPQPFKILEILVRSAGRVVTREDLITVLWGDATHVEYDQSINSSMRKIRRALGDDAQATLFIETLPRKGYRFIAPVQTAANGAEPPGGGTSHAGLEGSPGETAASRWNRLPARAAMRRERMLIPILGAGALLVAAGLALATLWPASSPDLKPMLAVLPFQVVGEPAPESIGRGGSLLDDGADGAGGANDDDGALGAADPAGLDEMDHFGAALADEVASRVARLGVPDLGLIARNSLRGFNDSSESIRAMPARIGATHVLTGTVRWLDEGVRVNAELVRAADLADLWSDTFEVSRDELAALRGRLATRVAAVLAPHLQPMLAEENAGERLSVPLYDDYLKASYLLDRGDAASVRRSITLFERFVEQNTDDPRGHAGLAEAVAMSIFHGIELAGPGSSRAAGAAERALALDESNVDAHMALGCVRLHFDWDLESARRSLERALELAPGEAEIHSRYASLLAAQGRHAEAIDEARLAVRLDPLGMAVRSDLCWYQVYGGAHEDAVATCEAALELEPEHQSTLLALAEAESRLGRRAEAFEAMGRGFRLPEALRAELAATADPLAALHVKLLDGMRAAGETRPVDPFFRAIMHAQVGELDDAVRWIERARQERNANLIYLLVDPRLESLRNEPAVTELARQAGLVS